MKKAVEKKQPETDFFKEVNEQLRFFSNSHYNATREERASGTEREQARRGGESQFL
ncbi:MAG: hypothetical protein I4N51_07710 [Acinetobacter sp.]|nr:hypothetical protein [Acinetobacter sp.]